MLSTIFRHSPRRAPFATCPSLLRPVPPGSILVSALAAVFMSATAARAGTCDDLEAGYTLETELREHPDWFYESSHSGPRPTGGNGVGGSIGLAAGSRGFVWVARPFRFSDSTFTGCHVSMDFQADSTGTLADDRIGWAISDTDDSSDWHFGVQVDPSSGGTGTIECYWDGDTFGDNGGRSNIVEVPSLDPNAWYRLAADFTKLTATSCRIDASLTAVDGDGNETSVVAEGSLFDTDDLPGTAGSESPNAGYFTAPMMWPVFKNYSETDGAADNPCFELTTGGANEPPQPELVSPADDSAGVSGTPELRVTVTDREGTPCDVTFFGRQLTSTAGSFTLIPLPDTQNYSASHPEIFAAQTQWIADSRASRNIVFVAHEGDLVDSVDVEAEWMNADAAMSLLEDPSTTGLPEGIPYSVLPGNHDAPTTQFNEHFGVARFQDRSYYGGHHGADNDNNFAFFSASGMDFLVVSLEMNPSPDAVAWADSLIGAHPFRRAILLSHELLDWDGTWGGPGEDIYDAVKDNPNLFLMLCGHNTGEAVRTDVFEGHTVHTLLSCYQDHPSGGNGWLRILEFQPALDRIRVSTYSPTLDAYGTDPLMGQGTTSQDFLLPYDMTPPPASERGTYTVLGTVTNVPSGTDAAVWWPGLDPLATYEWTVDVSDGALVTTGPIWQFSTGAPTAVAESGPGAGVRLRGCVPNPGRPETRIRFETRVRSSILLRIYDVRGRAVATLLDGPRGAGLHEIPWDARDARGRSLPAGVYFYRVTGAGRPTTGKITIIR